MTLGFVPCQALLNDINPHLVNFYRWLKRGLVTTLPMQNDEDQFYVCRERFNQLVREGLVDSQEAAELFYYLNRTCFNGLCRFNRRGEFNVPFGRYKQIAYKSDFTIYKDVFAGWSFTVGDFQQVPLNSDDFIYADPPYDVEFTQYSKEAFGWHEQVRLALWLARHEGPVVLSNQATPRIVDLYQQLDFDLRFFDAPRRISNTGDRTPAKEVVATRNVQAHSNAILG